jgi:cbb3-type cytochrome c oxidase subunit II
MRLGKFSLEMTPLAAIVGSMLVFLSVVATVVFLPTWEYHLGPHRAEASDVWRARTALEDQGRAIYIANGCQYCHSQYVRAQDYDYGVQRVAQGGDYVADQPPLLGSERLGPDLSPEGGLRSDDWHRAHFINPRFTRPQSIMPPFEWMVRFVNGRPDYSEITTLTAFIQGLGYRVADGRMGLQRKWKAEAIKAYEAGPIRNMEWLHSEVPASWMGMPSEYPATHAALKRGEKIYEDFCLGCHGPVGDGEGPAKRKLGAPYSDDPRAWYMYPPPFNFTYLRRQNGPLGGMIYYQVMNGITGTGMMPFKTELESEKIWDVGSYVLVYFAGGDDWGKFDNMKRGIPASFETDVETVKAPKGKEE